MSKIRDFCSLEKNEVCIHVKKPEPGRVDSLRKFSTLLIVVKFDNSNNWNAVK